MKITDQMRRVVEIVGYQYQFRDEQDRIIRELAPLILEEAAKAAENCVWDNREDIVADIRALKEAS